MDYHTLVARIRREVVEVTPAEVAAAPPEALVDIREPEERLGGAIPGSLAVPRGVLELTIERLVPDRGRRIVLYCSAGHRSVLAAHTLQTMGYAHVASLAGGFERWKREGRPWDLPGGLSGDQRVRYDRHLRLPEVGEKGQLRLMDAAVAVVGAGGLGSPVLLYLAAAGIGTLGIVDGDRVDPGNLQRQVVHRTADIGRTKVDSARDAVHALNPDVRVVGHTERIHAGNALEILSGYDVIVDGADNFPTRYLLNDAALHLRTPVVHGSVLRFEGQVSVFSPYRGPCYRCLFPEPPPPDLAPSCAEAGVLGALPGTVGAMQAVETLKLVLGVGDPLVGRLLVYDALAQSTTALRVHRDPACPACGDEEHPPTLVDYDASCRRPGAAPA